MAELQQRRRTARAQTCVLYALSYNTTMNAIVTRTDLFGDRKLQYLENGKRQGLEHLPKSRLQDLNRRFYTTVCGRASRKESFRNALNDLKVALDPNDGIL